MGKSTPNRTRLGWILAAALAVLAGARGIEAAEPISDRTKRISEDIDWKRTGARAAELLARYIRIDTSNPPGNEREAAFFLHTMLRRAGIPSRLYAAQPGRENLIGRVDGSDPRLKPVLMLNHTDVVPADPEGWNVEPFDGVIRDGYVWGRGALDCKGLGIMEYLALALIKENGIRLRRSVLYVAAGDEEAGGDLGAGWLVENHFRHLDPAVVINEGGSGIRGFLGSPEKEGGRTLYGISSAEKGLCWVRMTARGSGGHGSMPPGDTANRRLVRALERLDRYEAPLTIIEENAELFRRLAPTRPFYEAFVLRHLDLGILRWLARGRLESDPRTAAMLRNTVALTNLRAGHKENVIPNRAEAVLDCRLLPGTEHEAFVEELRKVADDETIDFEIIKRSKPNGSDYRTEFFSALERVILANDPEAIVAPILSPGATDSRFFRARGVPAYGFLPIRLTAQDIARVHGQNERISIENLGLGTKILFELILELAL